MKKQIFLACAALVVSAAAVVVGVKAYNYYSMSQLMRANLEALTNGETPKGSVALFCNKVEDKTSVCVAACPICHYPHIDSTKGQELSTAFGSCEKCERKFSIRFE